MRITGESVPRALASVVSSLRRFRKLRSGSPAVMIGRYHRGRGQTQPVSPLIRGSRPDISGHRFILTLGAACALLYWPAQAAPQLKARTPPPRLQAQPAVSPDQAAEQAIQLPEIVVRAEELDLLLRQMNERLKPDPTLNSIDQYLRTHDELVRARRREVDELITANPTLIELQEIEKDWQAKYNQYAAWSQTLTERVKAVEEDVRTLARQQEQWEATLNQIEGPGEIKSVIDRVRDSINQILASRSKANEQLTRLVTLQNRVSQQAQAVSDVLESIRQAKGRLQRSLLERDALPLWEMRARRQSEEALDIPFRRSLSGAMLRAEEYLRARILAVSAIFAFFLGVLSICIALRHRVLRRSPEEPSTAVHLHQHPIALALLTTLTITLPLTANMPALLRNLVAVLFVVPVLRFLPSLIHPVFRPLLYLLIVFGLTVWISEMLPIPMAVKRELSAGLSLAAIALCAWLIRPARTRPLQPYVRSDSLVIIGARAALVLILGSLLANIFGYVGLSRVLRSGTILSAFFAIALYTAYIGVITLFSLFWKTGWPPWFSSIRTHGEMVAKWGMRLLAVTAVAIWLYATLSFFTIRESVMGALSSVLTTSIKWGAVDFSLGDVLTFVLIFVLGVIFANIIRGVLRTDVLMRLPLKHGLSYAISTITYYVLLLAVFLLALAASGVELSRFTLLTGAFGVGAGFGLQNIISNFFSGIILLFERPIRIGDSLDIGDTSGDVERIGMRSTSIRTAQGAEVIVPNSILISSQVTNWTLTQQRRRVELAVPVVYDTDPDRVLNLLIEVAGSHHGVLRDPEPTALFLGFGNNALNFELRFWVAQAGINQQVKSEVGVKVAAALKKSGIEIALPRQETYIKSIDAVDRESLSLGASAPRGGNMTEQRRQE
jgi:potassium-dependent mechanosensitive channel